MSRFKELEGARGVFALGVVLIHADVQPLYWLNVMMDGFFVISAFLITLGLLNSRATTRRQLLGRFYWRRTARIFPPYYALLACIAGLLLLINAMPASMNLRQYSLMELVPYVFYLQYTDLYGAADPAALWDHHLRFIYPTWSLAVEEQFYLLWGLLFVLLPSRRAKFAAALMFIVIGTIARWSNEVAAVLILYRIDAFGYGIAAALFFDRAAKAEDWASLQRPVGIAVVSGLAVLVMFVIVIDVPGTYYRWLFEDGSLPYFDWSPATILSCYVAGALVFCLACCAGHPVLAVLRTQPLRYLGRISYAMYLFHYPIIDILLYLNHPVLQFAKPINIAIVVTLTLIVAHLVTQVFERVNDRLVANIGRSAPLPVAIPKP